VNILVEMLSTLALATKEAKEGQLSEVFLAGMTLDSMLHREIHEEASGREGHQGNPPEIG
jgi:hypothetical protein